MSAFFKEGINYASSSVDNFHQLGYQRGDVAMVAAYLQAARAQAGDTSHMIDMFLQFEMRPLVFVEILRDFDRSISVINSFTSNEEPLNVAAHNLRAVSPIVATSPLPLVFGQDIDGNCQLATFTDVLEKVGTAMRNAEGATNLENSTQMPAAGERIDIHLIGQNAYQRFAGLAVHSYDTYIASHSDYKEKIKPGQITGAMCEALALLQLQKDSGTRLFHLLYEEDGHGLDWYKEKVDGQFLRLFRQYMPQPQITRRKK